MNGEEVERMQMALRVLRDASVWHRLKTACDEIGFCCFTPAT